MGRIIFAVAVGYGLIACLVMLTDAAAARVIPGFASMRTPPVGYFYVSVVTATLYTIAGGYLCAVVARARSRQATIGLMVFGEIMGVVSLILFWAVVPHWYGFALLVIYPPATWFGSRLRAGKSRAAVAG